MMERLTERDPYWLGEEYWVSAREPGEEEIDAVYEKLKCYEDLEEEGKLIRLPCKPRDKVWLIKDNEVVPMTVVKIEIKASGRKYVLNNFTYADKGIAYGEKRFGEIIFPTIQEALEALEGMKK